MIEEAISTEEGINALFNEIEKSDWILANAVRLVYYAGFHKNEIINVKIENVYVDEAVVSEIIPFLPKTKKAYSSRSIILDDKAKSIIQDHIKKLFENGYLANPNGPLFPSIKTNNHYVDKTFTRNYKKYFGKITFDDLRKYGIKRKEDQLEGKDISKSQRQKELEIYSRHSRSSTTKKLITGDVQKAGKFKKVDLPWESVVRSIEGLTNRDKKKRHWKKI